MPARNATNRGRNFAPSKECLGCKNCTGLCREIVDLLAVPAIVLKALARK